MATLTTTEIPISTETGLDIGLFHIEDSEPGRIFGTFHPGTDYPNVERHFLYFEELVNDQVLSLTDEAADKINALGLTAQLDGVRVPIHNVQIYCDGGSSFQYTTPPVNGFHH